MHTSKSHDDIQSMIFSFNSNSIREIINAYYSINNTRTLLSSQSRRLKDDQLSSDFLQSFSNNLYLMEKTIKNNFQSYIKDSTVGFWALSQYGIGTVFVAGLMAYIDITKAPNVSNIWRYAGLDPNQSIDYKDYNQYLKSLCLKIGNTFKKFSYKDDCFYGQLYLKDKERRTSIYSSLPSSRIDAQARRYAVKIFLSHYHSVAYQDYYGTQPLPSYIIQSNPHLYEIPIPNNPFV
jgi:hypothetical protein